MPVSLKLSDLSFINGADLTDSDLFLVTDTESRTSKKLSFRTLKNVIGGGIEFGSLRGIDLSSIPPVEGDFLKFSNGFPHIRSSIRGSNLRSKFANAFVLNGQ